jgi:ABC-2 type transport system ATP-binding protein
MTNALELTGVGKSFPGFTLKDVSFTLPTGYIMGLVGPNGAGKTTCLQLILNMLEKQAGAIKVLGMDHVQAEQEIKQQIGVVLDSIFYADSWTVGDTGKAVSLFYADWRPEVFKEMTTRFELLWKKKVSDLSRGMQMKLMLAVAFSHNAKLLILDEPTSGLDPVSRDELLEILQDYIKDGDRSVLFSTHITTDLEKIADYITFIHQGELFYSGGLEDLRGSYRLVKGNPRDLTPQLEHRVIGLRNTAVGFTGLIRTDVAASFRHCLLDTPSIDDIVIHVSKKGVSV